ncbi:MAG TPA: hypothetical protein VGC30_10065 [Dokdonella sp.]
MLGRLVVGLLGCLGFAAAHADALTDLRAKLAGFGADGALAATLDLRCDSRVGAGDAAKTADGRIRVDVEDGPRGLRLGFDRDLLARAAREAEARAKDPEMTTPLGDALDKATPANVAALTNVASALLRLLDGATLKESRADTHAGAPAQLLVLDLPARLDREGRDALKHFDAHLKLWLDASGVPLAAEERATFDGRKFLIGFEGSLVEEARYEAVGARLVAVSRSREETFSGFGLNNRTKTVTTLTLQGR